MKIVCAWCKRHLGEKEVSQLPKDRPAITHTICPACFKRVLAEMENDPEQSDQTATNYHEKEIVK